MARTATIATLAVNLTANSAQFTSALNRSRKKSINWSKAVRNSVNAAGKAFSAMAIATGVALAAMYSESSKVIDELGKMSDRLNFATEKLAGFHLVTELNGESTASFDKAITKMVRGIGEAERGFGTSKSALDRLGISIDDLKGKRADEQFVIISEKIKGVATQTEKASLAADIFGRAGIGLLNTINQGAEGFEKANSEAELFGLALTRIDAGKVEQANDSSLKLGKIWDGFSNKLTVKIAPIITGLANTVTEYITSVGGMGNIVSNVMNFGAKSVGVFADGIHGLKVTVLGLKLSFTYLGSVITKIWDYVVSGAIKVGKSITEYVLKPVKWALEFASEYSDSAKNMLDSLNGFEQVAIGRADAVANFFSDVNKSSEKATEDAIKAFNDAALSILPSEAIKNKMAEWQYAAQVAAENVAGATKNHNGDIEPAKPTNSFQEVAEFVGDSGLPDSEREKIIADFDAKETIVDENFQRKLINEETRNKVLLGLEEKKEAALRKLKEKESTWGHKFDQANYAGKANMLAAAGQRLMSISQGQSKKMFKLGKAAALANAAVSLPDAVIQSFQNGGGYPWGLIPAGLMLATGIKNIQQIKNTKFNGGGSVGSISAGSSSASMSQPEIKSKPSIQSSIPTIEDKAKAEHESSNFQTGQVVTTVNIYETKAADDDDDVLLRRIENLKPDANSPFAQTIKNEVING